MLTSAIYVHFESTTVIYSFVANFRWFSADFRHVVQNYRKNPYPENIQPQAVWVKDHIPVPNYKETELSFKIIACVNILLHNHVCTF
jgi:hypothetical protein